MAKQNIYEELINVTGGVSEGEEFGVHKYTLSNYIEGYENGEFRIKFLELLSEGRYKISFWHEAYCKSGSITYCDDETIEKILNTAAKVTVY